MRVAYCVLEGYSVYEWADCLELVWELCEMSFSRPTHLVLGSRGCRALVNGEITCRVRKVTSPPTPHRRVDESTFDISTSKEKDYANSRETEANECSKQVVILIESKNEA